MRRTAPWLCVAAALLGCPKKVDFGPGGPIEDPAELLAKVDAAEAKISSVNGDARLRIVTPQGPFELNTFIAAERPARLRIESFDFFNRPLAALSSDGQRFGLWDAESGVYYTGPASPRNLARFLRVELRPDEVVAILLGAAPRLEAAEQQLEVDGEAGLYRLTLLGPERSQALWIHPLHQRVVRSSRQGAGAYDLEFGDLFASQATAFPREVKLAVPPAGVELRVRFSGATFNERQDPSLFTPEAPEGVPVVELDESGEPVGPVTPRADP